MSEHALQRACVQLLRVYEARGLLAYAHCPNGELRHPAVGGRLKGMGTRSGVPDLLLWLPEGRSFGVELKAGTRDLSPAQVVWHSTLASLGHRVYVVRSVDELEQALRAEGVPVIGYLWAGKGQVA